jgi:hypothetical protein
MNEGFAVNDLTLSRHRLTKCKLALQSRLGQAVSVFVSMRTECIACRETALTLTPAIGRRGNMGSNPRPTVEWSDAGSEMEAPAATRQSPASPDGAERRREQPRCIRQSASAR